MTDMSLDAASAAHISLAEAIAEHRGEVPCQQTDAQLWWMPDTVSFAQELCGYCPVRRECLHYAQEGRELRYGGVWGGVVTR